MISLKRFVLLLIVLFSITSTGSAQTNLEVFGQNRIQYRRFDWQFYDASHFKIYHYDKSGKELARYVAEQAEQDINALERKVSGIFPEKLNIILYNNYDDFQQSNIGLSSSLDLQGNNQSGTVNIVGDKLIIYFTGKHADLKKQLREGIAQIIMEHLLFGDNIKEMVRSTLFLNLPKWVSSGYIDYVVSGWQPADESEWKNLLSVEGKVYFDVLGDRYPRLAGKAFWKYIATKYGDNNVKNILYLTEQKSSIDKAMQLTTKMKLKQAYDSVIVFYKDRYQLESTLFETIDSTQILNYIAQPNEDARIRDIKVSPRGNDVAFVKWKHGQSQVILKHAKKVESLKDNLEATILFEGVKNYREDDDPNYPLISWSNTGYKLGIIYKVNNQLRIRVYDGMKGKKKEFKIPANKFERITGFTFMEDDDMIILSAIKKGQSDLFEFRMQRSRLTQITDDAWDDLDPTFVSGGSRKGVVFLSNRPEPSINIRPLPNELPVGVMNAYFYNATTKSYDLLQLTKHNQGEIESVIPYGHDHFAYTWDVTGIRNRYVVLFGRDGNNKDTAYSVPMTNYNSNILYQQYNPASSKVAEVIQQKDRYAIMFNPIALPKPDGNAPAAMPVKIPFVDGIFNTTKDKNKGLPINVLGQQQNDTIAIQGLKFSDDQAFQSPYTKSKRRKKQSKTDEQITETNTSLTDSNLSIPNDTMRSLSADGKRVLYVDSTYIAMRSQKYRLSLKADNLSLRADNSILFNRYQPYDMNVGFDNPALSGMFIAKLSDLMEDYRFTGGFRFAGDFNGYTTFFQFENYKRRVDWGLLFLRQETKSGFNVLINNNVPLSLPSKTTLNMLQMNVAYPLNKVSAFRLAYGVRQDIFTVKAESQPISLVMPTTYQYWANSRAEYVYDDTKNPATNIWNGLRYKLFAEYMYRLYSNNQYFNVSDTFTNNKASGMYNIGFDFRYYHKIYKDFIFAIRASGAHSGGNQKVMYALGGVDNAINAKYENSLQPTGNNDYAFRALATNLRGYDNNARNGNNYALVNAELRLPLITTFLRRPVQSSLLKNLQFIAFTDIGYAWEGGFVPDNQNSRMHTLNWPKNVANPTVVVTVPNYASNDVGLGYGAGLRTTILSYFLRFDVASNSDGTMKWYISLGTDF
jgi:hypothetical protein